MIERSASWRVMWVGMISKFPILWHIESGIKLMLAPKSIRTFPMDIVFIEQEMVRLLGSLNFKGKILWITALQLPYTTFLSLLMYLSSWWGGLLRILCILTFVGELHQREWWSPTSWRCQGIWWNDVHSSSLMVPKDRAHPWKGH